MTRKQIPETALILEFQPQAVKNSLSKFAI